jgi:hypothetical protein
LATSALTGTLLSATQDVTSQDRHDCNVVVQPTTEMGVKITETTIGRKRKLSNIFSSGEYITTTIPAAFSSSIPETHQSNAGLSTTSTKIKKKIRPCESWIKPLENTETKWNVLEVKLQDGKEGVFAREGELEAGCSGGCKGEYGGDIITKEECEERINNPDPNVREYLLEVTHPDGKKTYIDANPQLLKDRGVDPHLWIGAYAKQANTPEERNAQLSILSAPEQTFRPRRSNSLNPKVPVGFKIIKRVRPGQEVFVNYGYSVEVQYEKKQGYTYYHREVLKRTDPVPFDSQSSPEERGVAPADGHLKEFPCRQVGEINPELLRRKDKAIPIHRLMIPYLSQEL